MLRVLAAAGLMVSAIASAQAPVAGDGGEGGEGGEIRVTGSPADRALLERLQQGFRAHHPEVRFRNTLHGPESTLAGVYTGTADLAWMARELREPMERMAFEWVLLDKPYQVSVACAGLAAGAAADSPSRQLAFYVNARNPVPSLALAQLDSLLGMERLRGGAPVRQWRDLGVRGELADRPVALYGPPVDSTDALFVRRQVMRDSRKWNPGYRQIDDSGAVLRMLAGDPAGLALAPAGLRVEGVRELPIAAEPGRAAERASAEAIARDAYPLLRTIEVVVADTERRPLRGDVRAFLRYVLGPEGQRIIAGSGNLLPLSAGRLAAQRARVE